MTTPERRRFPAIMAVTRTYQTMFVGLRRFARRCWPWAAAAFAIIAVSWALRFVQRPDRFETVIITSYVLFGLLCLMTVGAASSWSRVLLTDGQRGEAAMPAVGGVLLAAFWSFVLLVIGVAAPIALASIFTLVLFMDPQTRLLAWIAIGGLFVASILIVARLSLLLPAASAGASFGPVRVWSLTRQNSWRLLFGGILVLAPTVIVLVLLQSLATRVFIPAGLVAAASARAILTVTGWMLLAGLGSTYLSLAYRFFVEKRDDLEGRGIRALVEEFR
jgi:hypothetical protein